ncbi:MAG TPA: DUF2809 domain-containing protein, partial [Sphingomonas sp.]|nr:DUF2809 domain-containing protein [Sphingomonas sp.]
VLRIGIVPAAIAAFTVGAAVELGQLAGLVDMLGLSHSAVARTLFGTEFEIWDFAAYATGAIIAALADLARERRR